VGEGRVRGISEILPKRQKIYPTPDVTLSSPLAGEEKR